MVDWSRSCDQPQRDSPWLEKGSETRQEENVLVLELEKSPVEQTRETQILTHSALQVSLPALFIYICLTYIKLFHNTDT